MRQSSIAAVLTSLVLAACGAGAQAVIPTPEPAAVQRCQAELRNVEGYGRVDAISGAFEVTIGEFVRWSETRHGPGGPRGAPPRWVDRDPQEHVVVCYFDGSFSGFPRPRGETIPPPYDRLIIVATGPSGHVLDAAGYVSTLPIVRPGR